LFQYTAEREVRRPAGQVFAYLSDVTRQPEWVHGVTECHWTGGGQPIGVGSSAEQSMRFLGKLRVVPVRVIDYQPGRRVAFEKREPFLIRFAFEVDDQGGTTRVRYPVEMEPRGLFRVLIPLIGRRTIEGDLVRIAGKLESLA
jgi:uncharacterized protein YndB with AHSA1/START domain